MQRTMLEENHEMATFRLKQIQASSPCGWHAALSEQVLVHTAMPEIIILLVLPAVSLD